MVTAETNVLLANGAVGVLLTAVQKHLQSRNFVIVEKLCRDALEREPAASDAWHLLAIALAEQNVYTDATRAAQRATDLLPGNASYWVTSGIIAFDQSFLEEAQANFRNAVKLDPELSHAHYFLGRSYHRANRYEDAISAYRKALRRAPGRAEIHFQLARALLKADRAQDALDAFQSAFTNDPQGTLDRSECIDCFRRLPIRRLPEFWRAELTRFFNRGDIDTSRYAIGGLYVLMARPEFRTVLGAEPSQCIKSYPTAIAQIMEDPLFGILLRDGVIGHPQFEIVLTRLRRELLLDRALRAQAPLRFLCDLALQCFNNEFVYLESAIETAATRELSDDIERELHNGLPCGEQFMHSLAVLAMYRPLSTLKGIATLVQGEPRTGDAKHLLARTIADVLEERELRGGIPVAGQIIDAVSSRVRAQYEESPYPRWIAFDRGAPVSAFDWLAGELAPTRLTKSPSAPLNVLVAGCGTGLEAVSLATKVLGVRVTAIDLSLASLAYAKRKANTLGLSNITFVQADILDLTKLSERFDVVLSVGVLHHMREPQQGLRALTRLMRPGGLLKIGLYSERARSAVNAVRQIIRERQLAPTDTAIREIRQEVLAADRNSEMASLLRWRDFFTMSDCRDLLFHVQEHQFRLPQIAEMLRAEQLTVVGLSKDLPANAVRAYERLAPDDKAMTNLATWDAVEAKRPDTFQGMYVVWCQMRTSTGA
jgi:2-polyprenyl-3-methyl-5-hydroxy-6-metoxy-1,4-benzoquinol methylase